MPDQIPDIYKLAIKRYEEITKEKLDSLSIARLTTVDELTKAIDAENQNFTTYRKKRHEIFAALSVAMRPVELVAEWAAGGASNVFPPSSLVFGAVAFLIKAAKDISAKYDAIVDLMESLKDFTVRLEVYNQEKVSKALSNKLAEIIVTLIDIFALSRKEIRDGRFLNYTKHILLKSDLKVQDAVAKLAKLTESEDRLVGAETLTEVKKAGGMLDAVSMTVTSTNVAVSQMSGDMSKVSIDVSQLTQKFDAFIGVSDQSKEDAKEAKGRTQQDDIKRVLQPSVSALDWYDKINKTRVPETGNWIREEKLFSSWVNKEIPILWVAGNPGTGKSYIASNIISFLREQYPQGVHHTSNVSVGYFFFKDDNPDTRSFNQALRDIAYQMSQNDPAYAKYIASTCDSAKEIGSLHSIWRTMFVDYFLGKKNVESSVYMLLDGMDESHAESREQFLELIKDLHKASKARIQIVMLGRPQLIEEFEMTAEITPPTIYVWALNNSNDIVHYIESSIKKSASLKRSPKALQAEIIEKLSSGAQGMFIWVDFMLKELLKKRNEGAIRTALNSAPRGLDKMIRHVLEGFSVSLKDDTDAADELNTLLAWVTCAHRPLTLQELDSVLKVTSPTGDGNWWLEGTLRKQFASFFMLIREDGLTTADLQRARIMENEFATVPSEDVPEDGLDDVENETNFDSDPVTTTVTFCHASIGDFFRNETETKAIAEENCPAIGLEFDQSKVSVLKTYFTVLCSEPSSEIWTRAEKLLSLIRSHWLGALAAVDITKTRTEDKIFIGTSLVQILSDDQHDIIQLNVAAYFGWNQFHQFNVDLVEKWVTDSEVFNALPKKHQDWVLSTSENRAELFLPYAKFFGEQWLRGLFANAQYCAISIYAFIGLYRKDKDSVLNTPEKVMEAAEWCKFEQNALWHRRLAMALRDNGYFDAAILHFQTALELDPSMWLARAGEAICYYKVCTKKGYEKAVELDNITANELGKMHPDETKTRATIDESLHRCLQRMANCLEELGREEEALSVYVRAFSFGKRCETCLFALIQLYNKSKRHEDIMKLFKSLNDRIEGLDHTRLTESLLMEGNYRSDDVYFDMIAEAAFKMNDVPFLSEMYQKAIIVARKQHKSVQATHLELSLATIYDRYSHDSERAARIWERIVETYRSTKAETEIADAKSAASSSLACYWLKKAVKSGKESSDAERCGTVLERLAKVKIGSRITINASESTLMLGSWYKLMGRDKEAWDCFQVQVKEGIRMLSDDDPENDSDAYWKLICVLVPARDDKNAIAMLWMYLGAQEGSSNDASGETSSEDSTEVIEASGNKTEEDEGKTEQSEDVAGEDESSLMDCDGCLQPIVFDNVAFCRYCFDTAFCADCFSFLKSGELPVNVCSPKHEWLVVEPRSQEARAAMQPGKILMDGEYMSVDEWKKMMAVQWNI